MASTCRVGGNRRYLGLVYIPEKFLAEAGVDLSVPESEGVYPLFTANTTEDQKKREISKFIEREKGIKIVDVIEELLKGLFTKDIAIDYGVELKEGLCKYDGRTLRVLLDHAKSI